eukprot:s5681_g8.t1
MRVKAALQSLRQTGQQPPVSEPFQAPPPRSGPGAPLGHLKATGHGRQQASPMALTAAARFSLRARAGLLGLAQGNRGARVALPLRAFSGGQGSPWSSLEQFGRETMGKASEVQQIAFG